MTTFGPPPTDTSILAYAPFFPNGQVNDAWSAWFTSLSGIIIAGPVQSFNGRTGVVSPVSGDYPASLIPFTQAGTGAVATDLNAVEQQEVRVFGWLTAAQQADVTSNTGSIDLTSAIQAAISANYGKKLKFAAGTYYIAGSLTNTDSITLEGSGIGSILKFNTTGAGISVASTETQAKRTVIRGFKFTQTGSVPSAFIANTVSLNLLVDECYFRDAAVTYCVDNLKGYGTTIRKCVFGNITGSGVRLRDDGAVNYYSYVADIVDCDFTGMSVDAIDVEGARCLNIQGCAIEACSGYGIYTNSNGGSGGIQSWGINISGCDFESNTLADIKLGTDGNLYWGVATLKNCTFSSTPNIDLGAKSKIYIESTYCNGGSLCTITGSSVAEAVLVNCTNFTQSGTFAWTTLAGGILSLPNGSAANPPLNLGDTTTGFYRQSSGKIGFTASGANVGDFSAAGWNFGAGPVSFNAGVNAQWINGSSTAAARLAGGSFTLFQLGPTTSAITNTQFGNGALNNSLGAFVDTTSAGVINFKVGTTALLAGSFGATGKFTFFVPVAGTASANFPVGVTVTSPAAGDLWNDANGVLNFKGNFGITGYTAKAVGGSVSSAATITPTGPIFHITGTTTVNTINLPYTGFTGSIQIIPDAATPFGSSGNIATATVCVTGKTMTMTYDGSKWFPSY